MTLFIIWYSLSWVGLGLMALHQGKISLGDIVYSMMAGWMIALFALPIYSLSKLLESFDDISLWRKP